MSILAPPALSNMDGIACGAVADFELCEPFRWIGGAVAAEDQAIFYAVIGSAPVDPPDVPGDSGGTMLPRYMMVEQENRVMVLCEPCNEMVVCRDNS